MINPCIVVTTTPTKDDASNIADKLINKKLAACISIKKINSIYQYNNNIVDSIEYELNIKTNIEHYNEIIELITSIHPYDIPQILCIKIEKSTPQYLNWLHSVTQ